MIARVIEIAWRYEDGREPPHPHPATAEEALFLLRGGNLGFADLGRSSGDQRYVIPVAAEELGFGGGAAQTPFAAVLGCADARVPLEMVFSQPANEMFVVRVAGNIMDGACVGSLDYAITHVPTLRLLAVVGHTQCGAVRAAADAYLDPAAYLGLAGNMPLRTVVDSLLPAVRTADYALRAKYGHDRAEQSGFYDALVDVAVTVNAAIAAVSLGSIFTEHLGERLQVCFGVYDLNSRLVGLPDPFETWRPGLGSAPADMDAFVGSVVDSQHVATLLRPVS